MAKKHGLIFGFGDYCEDPETGEARNAYYGTTWPIHYTNRKDPNNVTMKLWTYLSNR